MKVRMLVSIAGLPEPKYGLNSSFSFAPGEVVNLDKKLAQAWIACGHAEKIAPKNVAAEEQEEPETTSDSEQEASA